MCKVSMQALTEPDRQLFAELVAYAERRLLDPSAPRAIDAARSSLEKALERFPSPEQDLDRRRYAFGCMRRHVIKLNAKFGAHRQRYVQPPEGADAADSDGSNALEELIDNELRDAIRECLSKVRDKRWRKALYLKFWVGETLASIADQSGLRLNSVASQLYRPENGVLNELRKCLGRTIHFHENE
jgi:DNA-directed RNA polymerase specialized sigma24 family protein